MSVHSGFPRAPEAQAGGDQVSRAPSANVTDCWVIVPVFNEQRHVEAFMDHLQLIVPKLPAIRCVVFVDDGSTDETAATIEARLPSTGWRLLRSPRNRGKGAAMRLGLAFAESQAAHAVIFMDGDCQHDPGHLAEFLARLETSPVVFGYRLLSDEAPWVRRTGNRVASTLIRCLFGIRRRDLLCGFAGFRSDAFAALTWTSDGYGVEAELATIIARRSIRFAEVNVSMIYLDPRKGVHLGHALRILACVPRWYFRNSRRSRDRTP